MSTTYHTKEIEIAGEKITAEYFESSFNFRPIERTGLSQKFSNLWDTVTLPFWRLKYEIKNIYWDIRYGFQRMKKGYDYLDTISAYSKFIDRYTKILKAYKENMHGHPGRMTEEEWNNIIDKMIFHLYYMDEENVDEELSKDIPESWLPTLNTTYNIMEHHKNEFFKLFSEHFYDLWD